MSLIREVQYCKIVKYNMYVLYLISKELFQNIAIFMISLPCAIYMIVRKIAYHYVMKSNDN